MFLYSTYLDSVGRVVALEVELFIPFRVELLRYRLGPLFGLANLDSHVWVGGASLVFGYQSLRAYH